MEKQDIKRTSWLKKTGQLVNEVFALNWKNILSVFLLSLLGFTIIQLATAGVLKCTLLLVEGISGKDYIAANNILDYLKQPLIILATSFPGNVVVLG